MPAIGGWALPPRASQPGGGGKGGGYARGHRNTPPPAGVERCSAHSELSLQSPPSLLPSLLSLRSTPCSALRISPFAVIGESAFRFRGEKGRSRSKMWENCFGFTLPIYVRGIRNNSFLSKKIVSRTNLRTTISNPSGVAASILLYSAQFDLSF